jgi:hypothetical protein
MQYAQHSKAQGERDKLRSFVSVFVRACSCSFGRDLRGVTSRLDDKRNRQDALHYKISHVRNFVTKTFTKRCLPVLTVSVAR